MPDEPEVIDAQIVEDQPHQPAPEAAGAELGPAAPASTSKALATRERRSEVIRPLDAEQLVQSFAAYQELLPKLLDSNDYQAAGQGKRFVKKSGWRKIATAFDLDVSIIDEQVERDHDGTPLRAKVIARAVAPSGRAMDGDGYCSIDEDRFSGPRGNKSKLENDLRATATTRAKNRAISDLVGMGEVSAEEVDGKGDVGGAPPWALEASDPRKLIALEALTFLLGEPDHQLSKRALSEVKEALGVFPEGIAVALSRIGRVVQQARSDQPQTTTDRQPAPPPQQPPVAASSSDASPATTAPAEPSPPSTGATGRAYGQPPADPPVEQRIELCGANYRGSKTVRCRRPTGHDGDHQASADGHSWDDSMVAVDVAPEQETLADALARTEPAPPAGAGFDPVTQTAGPLPAAADDSSPPGTVRVAGTPAGDQAPAGAVTVEQARQLCKCPQGLDTPADQRSGDCPIWDHGIPF